MIGNLHTGAKKTGGHGDGGKFETFQFQLDRVLLSVFSLFILKASIIYNKIVIGIVSH